MKGKQFTTMPGTTALQLNTGYGGQTHMSAGQTVTIVSDPAVNENREAWVMAIYAGSLIAIRVIDLQEINTQRPQPYPAD